MRIDEALPAPKTPQENAARIAAARAEEGDASGNTRGDAPDRKRGKGNPVFGRKGGSSK